MFTLQSRHLNLQLASCGMEGKQFTWSAGIMLNYLVGSQTEVGVVACEAAVLQCATIIKTSLNSL